MSTFSRIFHALSGIALFVFAAAGVAQDFPGRSVRLVVPFPPAGVTDRIARLAAQKLGELWRQPVVIDNRPGASGIIAAELVAKAAPDGYTLLFGHIGTHAINASLFAKLPYRPVRDFAPVSLFATVPNLLLIHPSVPANSVTELIALAKARPGTLTYASPGSGTSGHMAGELFKSLAGVDIVHIPYKGAGAALQDVLSGQVSMMFDTVASSLPQARAGKLKGLAVTSASRVPIAPEIPTVAESGVPEFEIAPWFGVLAPAGTPASVVAKLSADLRRAVDSEEVSKPLSAQGVTLIGSSPQEFAAHIEREIPRWARIVKASGARAD
ncbi:MAG: tripartite tricarboxylate transporter substrate binding protein [Betaproteobacteria bacterium]|nr:tripartite tricarboxylate transporter substrate binding protein [Betaproteobacteria bacterium]